MHAIVTCSENAPPGEPKGVVVPFRRRISVDRMIEEHAAMVQAVAARQDRAAFAALFAFYAPRVKAWMLKSGSPRAAAEELAQETMLAVWRKAALFDPERAGASTWIFTIARNLRIDTVRRERHPSELMPDASEEPDAPAAADRIVLQSQHEARVRVALESLPADQAEVIRKAFFEDKAHAEIEKDLSIPLGTVKSRMRLAMNRLRVALGDLA